MTSHKQIEEFEEAVAENKKAVKELKTCLDEKLQQLQEVVEESAEEEVGV